MSREIICARCLKTLPDMDGCHTCTPSPLVRSLEGRIAELEQRPQGIGDGDIQHALDERDRYLQALKTAATYRNEMPPTCWVVIDEALHP